MGKIRDYFLGSWFGPMMKKDPEIHLKDNNDELIKNIYNEGMTTGEHIKKFHVIHYVFKYKYLVPLIRLGNKLLGKHIIKTIPQKDENRNILIFDKAFEKSLNLWYTRYLRNTGPPEQRGTEEQWLKNAKGNEELRSLKNYVITMYLYDTAYREFMNILLHELAKEMCSEYTKPEYKDKKTGHLFFTTDIYDVHYYILEKAIRYQTEIGLVETKKLLEDYYINEQRKRESVFMETSEVEKLKRLLASREAEVEQLKKLVEDLRAQYQPQPTKGNPIVTETATTIKVAIHPDDIIMNKPKKKKVKKK